MSSQSAQGLADSKWLYAMNPADIWNIVEGTTKQGQTQVNLNVVSEQDGHQEAQMQSMMDERKTYSGGLSSGAATSPPKRRPAVLISKGKFCPTPIDRIRGSGVVH